MLDHWTDGREVQYYVQDTDFTEWQITVTWDTRVDSTHTECGSKQAT